MTLTTTLNATILQYDWAMASSLELPSPTQAQITLAATNLEGRAGVTGKNIQGKAQEARGNILGDPKDQAAGKAKQAEGQDRNVVEDAKDSGASLQERVGATAKTHSG